MRVNLPKTMQPEGAERWSVSLGRLPPMAMLLATHQRLSVEQALVRNPDAALCSSTNQLWGSEQVTLSF